MLDVDDQFNNEPARAVRMSVEVNMTTRFDTAGTEPGAGEGQGNVE